jgi:hypothetical protein
MNTDLDFCFSPAEWSAVHVHKHYLSRETGHEVSIREAVSDWLERYARKWREQSQKLKREDGKNCLAEPRFSPAEWNAIRVHRYFLSQRYGRFVAINEAIEDWQKNYALIWRAKRTVLSSRNQMEEILKHKWIESEKAGHDLGSEAAADWIDKYADKWRMWWETE